MINDSTQPRSSFAETARRESRRAAAPLDLDQVMATAYQLYQIGRFVEVERLCRRLIALDSAYWWCHSLRAAALAQSGHFQEALDALDRGLIHERAHPKLLRLRTQILAGIGSTLIGSRLIGRRAHARRPAPLAGSIRRRGYGR